LFVLYILLVCFVQQIFVNSEAKKLRLLIVCFGLYCMITLLFSLY